MEMDFIGRMLLRLVDRISGPRIDRQARQACRALAEEPIQRSRRQALGLLESLARQPGPKVDLGETLWDEPVPVRIPLAHLVKAHAIITGGTGSGKTMAALAVVEALLAPEARDLSFGVLDAKGELFDRTLYLIVRRLETLPHGDAEALARRIVIIDLAARDPVTSYNIASPWTGSDLDYFATSRVDTLQELLPSGDGFSLRGAAIVKHALKLLAECKLPFAYFDRVLSSEPFRARLLTRSRNAGLERYFRHHFPSEGKAAVAAVRARLTSALLSSESLRLALSGDDAPDIRRLQDEGRIVLINCAGPNIARATAQTLQALFLSDIRQAVFARKNRKPFLWVCDEAQNFFRTRHLRDNMTSLLTMSRSFGSFFVYLTQNLGAAVPDGDMIETLYTNIRWSLTLRGTAKDAAFLRPALPVTGCRKKPRLHRYAPREYYAASEERGLLAEEIAHLPDRVGWLWLKSQSSEATGIRTRPVEIPEGAAFADRTAWIKGEAAIGKRLSRAAYEVVIARRDAEWLDEESLSPSETLTRSFRED